MALEAVLVKDINPSSERSTAALNDDRFIEFDGKLFFVAGDGVNGGELFVTDGTPDGTPDGTNGFQAGNDALIEITGYSGELTNLAIS